MSRYLAAARYATDPDTHVGIVVGLAYAVLMLLWLLGDLA